MTEAGPNGETALAYQSSASIPDSLAEILAEIAALTDRDELAEYLIETAGRFRGVPESVAVRPYPETNRVAGCESEAFVFAEHDDAGKVWFHFAVENPQGISAKALAVILEETLSGLGPSEIQSVPEDIIHQIFGATVSMGKGQGLMGMIRSTKAAASAKR